MDNVLRLLLLPLFLAAKQVVDCLLRMMTQEIHPPVPSNSPRPEVSLIVNMTASSAPHLSVLLVAHRMLT